MKKALITILSLLLLECCSPPVFAVDSGVSVSPAIIRIDLAKEEPEAVFHYTNNTGVPIEITLSAEDFTELEEGWKLQYLESKDAANYKYSLTSWIHFEKTNLNLAPGEETNIVVFIDKDKLPFGGHYASILANISSNQDKNKEVGLEAVLSSLLFVRAETGHEVISGEVTTFDTNQKLIFPDSALIRFKNTGNSEIAPHGQINITDLWDKEVARGIINEDSLIALPESIRRYTIPIRLFQQVYLPGFYTTSLGIHYDDNQEIVIQKKFRFFTLGSKNVVIVEISCFFLLLAVYVLYKRRRR